MSNTFQLSDNTLTLLRNGEEFFPQLCADIAAARHVIYLETYTFAADASGRMVSQALRQASARGVEVHLLLDGFGSAELPQVWVEELLNAGVDVQWFRRERGLFRLRRHRLRRLHRKLVAIDGEIACVGGINIVDDIPQEAGLAAHRLDYAVRVQGALACRVQEEMHHLLAMVTWATLRKRLGSLRAMLHPIHHPPPQEGGVQLLLRDSLRHRRDIERAYIRAISQSQHEVIIANAYFLPGRIFMRALLQAARRGVRVVLLLQGKVEYRMQHYATQALYARLLRGGVEICEYQPSFLHAKVAVVDGRWATVGSCNFDPLSLLLAREANVAVQHEQFAASLRTSLWQAISQDSIKVAPARLNWFESLRARLCLGLIRLALSVLGVARHK